MAPPYMRASSALYIGCWGSVSRHIMCWTRSVVSITPTSRSQFFASTRFRITSARSLKALSRSSMNVASSMRSSLSGQVASGHPSVRYGPSRSNSSLANDSGCDMAIGGSAGCQLTGDTYSCRSLPALIRKNCAIPLRRTSMLIRNSRSTQRLHSRSLRWIV